SAQSADHASRHGVLKTVWITDGNCQLAYAQFLRIAKRSGGKRSTVSVGDIHTNHRQIGSRIVADNVCGRRPAIGKRYLDSRRVVDDVAVGEHQAVRCEHKSGASAFALTLLTGSDSSKLSDVDFDHRRAEPFSGTDNCV